MTLPADVPPTGSMHVAYGLVSCYSPFRWKGFQLAPSAVGRFLKSRFRYAVYPIVGAFRLVAPRYRVLLDALILTSEKFYR